MLPADNVVELIDLLQEKYDQNGLSEVRLYLQFLGHNPEHFITSWGFTYGVSDNSIYRFSGFTKYKIHSF